jgi:hypothetical protein
MTTQEMLVKFLKGAAIAAATGILAWAGTSLLPMLEANGWSAAWIAIIGASINGAKLIVERLKSSGAE